MNETISVGISKEKQSEGQTYKEEKPSVPHLRIDRTTDEPLSPISKSKFNSTPSRMSSPDSSPSPPPSPTISRAVLPRLYRLLKLDRFLILLLISFAIGSIYVMLDSFQHHQRDVSGCQISYMRPQYIKQNGFDSEMTRFAGKYGLYLYREKGVDTSDQVKY